MGYISESVKKTFIIIISSVLLFVFSHEASAVILDISGSRFTFDGQQKFLTLVAYFDALDAQNLNSDLDYLNQEGINGIRIFPNWWDTTNPLTYGNTLMNTGGNLNQSRLNDLIRVIREADNRGMVVDVTFARETVPGPCNTGGRDMMCESEYKNGVVETVKALSGFNNVLYDLQNEFDGGITNLSSSHVTDLKNRIKNADPNAIISASTGAQSGSGQQAANNTRQFSFSITNVHSTGETSASGIAGIVSSALSAGKPVYMGEPYHSSYISSGQATAGELVRFATESKRSGAAAFVFHNRSGYNLDNTTIQANFSAIEKNAINQLSQALQNTTWGSGGGSGGGPTGPQGICPSGQISLASANASSADPTGTSGIFCDNDPVESFNVNYPVAGTLKCNASSGVAFVVTGYVKCQTWDFSSGKPVYQNRLIAEVQCPGTKQVTITNSNISAGAWTDNPSTEGAVCIAGSVGGGGPVPPPPPPPPPPPVPPSPPTITGINPQTAVAGQTIEIFGTNLINSTELESLSDGKFYTAVTSVNQSLTVATFEVPDLTEGTYRILMSGSTGSGPAISPQNLTIKSGGSSFGQVPQPTIPTEGLATFEQLVAMIFTWSLNILGIVVFVMIFYAGFRWFTAAGNTAQVNEAKSQITNAILGAILLLSAWIILYTINPDLVGSTIDLPGIGS